MIGMNEPRQSSRTKIRISWWKIFWRKVTLHHVSVRLRVDSIYPHRFRRTRNEWCKTYGVTRSKARRSPLWRIESHFWVDKWRKCRWLSPINNGSQWSNLDLEVVQRESNRPVCIWSKQHFKGRGLGKRKMRFIFFASRHRKLCNLPATLPTLAMHCMLPYAAEKYPEVLPYFAPHFFPFCFYPKGVSFVTSQQTVLSGQILR